MGNGIQLLFNPFVLDTSNQSPLRGTKKIVLTPKIFAVPDFLLNDNAKFPKFIETVPCEATPSNQVARPYQHIMVGRHADSISSGHTKNQGATQS